MSADSRDPTYHAPCPHGMACKICFPQDMQWCEIHGLEVKEAVTRVWRVAESGQPKMCHACMCRVRTDFALRMVRVMSCIAGVNR